MRQLLSLVLTLRTNVILHHLNVSEHPQQDLLAFITEVERQFLSIIASCTWTLSALAQVAWILPHTRSFLIFNEIQANSPAQGPRI